MTAGKGKRRPPTAAMRAVMRAMDGGASLVCGGLGAARLTGQRAPCQISARTFEGLLLRGLISRNGGPCLRGGYVGHWYLTERGLAEVRRMKEGE